jgi:hypothetical protein
MIEQLRASRQASLSQVVVWGGLELPESAPTPVEASTPYVIPQTMMLSPELLHAKIIADILLQKSGSFRKSRKRIRGAIARLNAHGVLGRSAERCGASPRPSATSTPPPPSHPDHGGFVSTWTLLAINLAERQAVANITDARHMHMNLSKFVVRPAYEEGESI